MVKTLVRASHRKYKKNIRGSKRTKRGRIIKKSKRIRLSSRKRVTMRRHMRNKRGGLLRAFQSDLLVEFKERIEAIPDLAECLKTFKEGKTPFNSTNSKCIDEVVNNIHYSNNNGDSSLRWWLEHCPEKDLLRYIDEETKEGKDFYKYVLLKLLAEKEDEYEPDVKREDNEQYHKHRIGTTDKDGNFYKITRTKWAQQNLDSLKTKLNI
jgi:hypothetical protein